MLSFCQLGSYRLSSCCDWPVIYLMSAQTLLVYRQPKCIKWNGVITLCILHLDTRWRCRVSFAFQPLYMQCILNRRLCEPQSQSEHGDHGDREKITCSCMLVIEPIFSHYNDWTTPGYNHFVITEFSIFSTISNTIYRKKCWRHTYQIAVYFPG